MMKRQKMLGLQNACWKMIEAERQMAQLQKEHEILQTSLDLSLPYYSTLEYNEEFRKKWDAETRKKFDRGLAIYCYTHAIRMRETGGGKSYPLTAWQDYLGEKL